MCFITSVIANTNHVLCAFDQSENKLILEEKQPEFQREKKGAIGLGNPKLLQLLF